MIAAHLHFKEPSEIWDISLDCSDNLFGGTVASAVVTAKIKETGVDISGTFVSGVPTIASPFATQRVITGTSGTTVYLQYVVTMSGGQKIDDTIIIPIKEI
jgi:hypothetical protein